MKNILLIIVILFNSSILLASCNNYGNEQSETNKIKSSKIIEQINKGKHVHIKDAVITDNLDFTTIENKTVEMSNYYRLYINSAITFENCTFEGKVIGFRTDKNKANYLVSFQKNLTFQGCTFSQEVNFRETIARGTVNFSNSTFNKKANFEGFLFSFKANYFKDVNFNAEAKFQRIVSYGDISFLKTYFTNNFSMQKAKIYGDLQFGGITSEKYFDFGSIRVFGNTSFNNSVFKQRANFSNAVFSGKAEFNYCTFTDNAKFKKTIFRNKSMFNECKVEKQLDFDNAKFEIFNPELKDLKKSTEAKINIDEKLINNN